MARRDTGKFLGGPLSSEFVKPRKISNMNKSFVRKRYIIFGEKANLSYIYTQVHSSELEEVNIYKQATVKEMRGI